MAEYKSNRVELIGLIVSLLARIKDEQTLRRLYARVNRAYVTDGREV